jgi:ATP-dependent Clp protease adaptor protein ClpS
LICVILAGAIRLGRGFIGVKIDYIDDPIMILTIRSDSMAHWMTDGDGSDDQVELVVKPRTRTQRPPMYKVLMLNDDFTPMEFVVHVLERLFNMTHAQAIEIMLTVHRKGVAVVGVFSHEVAETKVAQVMELARRQQHPLQCTMEKE